MRLEGQPAALVDELHRVVHEVVHRAVQVVAVAHDDQPVVKLALYLQLLLLDLLLEKTHEMRIEGTVHQHHGVTLVVGSLDVGVLVGGICGIKEHQIAILVGLVHFDQSLVLVDGEIFAFGILDKGELHGGVAELVVGEHAIFNEDADVVPLLFEIGTVILEKILKTLRHLLGDVARYLLDGAVALQIASRHIQGNVGRVDNALQQHHELRHHTLHRVVTNT